MRKRPVIPRLDGGPQTVLLVEDVDRAAGFYRQKLLLKHRDGDAGRYAELDTGDGGVLLLVKRDGSIAPVAAPMETESGATLVFSIEAGAYDSWKSWFERKEVAIERETRWIHGGRSLFVRDPEGRRIEFKTPAAVVPPKPVIIQPRKNED